MERFLEKLDRDRRLSRRHKLRAALRIRLRKSDLAERGAEFLVLLTASDETFMQTVHARSSYRYDEIVWGARFNDIFAQDRAAHDLTVNISRIHAYERTALP